MLVAASLVAAVIVAAVVAVVLMSGGVGNKDVKKIAVADVQTEVPKVLVDRTNGYVAGDIKDVRCNDGKDPTVKKGDTFTCTASVRGKQHQLTVTFQDDDGTYVVGMPQLDGGK
ncbi:DUF4333 domain-containing protein [Mycobacterium bourgelatii]|nr:DUF4333 domain-containing protein [Mycobacterium bourgelatii]MCV6977935.1 DUF4333 domain-containing protein [Mycobacterium bourgelatii]